MEKRARKCFPFPVSIPQNPLLFVAPSRSTFDSNPSIFPARRDLVIERKLTSRCGGGSAKLAVSVSISETSIFRGGGRGLILRVIDFQVELPVLSIRRAARSNDRPGFIRVLF